MNSESGNGNYVGCYDSMREKKLVMRKENAIANTFEYIYLIK